MDKLKTIIAALSDDDHRNFEQFLQRQKAKKDRKDAALLYLLRTESALDSEGLIKRLYPANHNQVAYHALRKRLMQQLTQFIMLKQVEDDPSAASNVMGLISLARFLFTHNADKLGWHYLKKAEKLASQNEQHDLLNTIYHVSLQYLSQGFPDSVEELLAKRERNQQLAEEDERGNIANSLIRYELQQMRKKGRDLDFDQVIQSVLSRYGLTEIVSKRPRLFFNLMSIARSSVIARRDFYTFEPFILGQYRYLEEQQGFGQQYHGEHLQFLYMIAHVLYRNKRFHQSLDWLEKLRTEMDRFKKSHYQLFITRINMLQAANFMFLNRIGEAIQVLESLLEVPRLKATDRNNALLNLGFYYFLNKQYQKSVRCNLELPNSDKELDRKMGREWTMKKILSEIILQFHLANSDLVVRRVRSLEKHYGDLLSRPPYQKGLTFLKVILEMNQARGQGSYAQIRERFPIQPVEQEDLQEMSFFAWLKSTLLNRDYYEVLLELVGRVPETQYMSGPK